MKKLLLLLFCSSGLLSSLSAQVVFETNLILRNAIGQEDTLSFGLAHGATRYIDTALGEVNILGDTIHPNQLNARFSDRFSVYDINGNHEIDSATGLVKMGVAPVTYESKQQFFDPWSDHTDWYMYYEINIRNTSWPLEVSASVTTNSHDSIDPRFVLTTFADVSRWFDLSPPCGHPMNNYFDFIDGTFYPFDSIEFCRFQTESNDTVSLLFIGIVESVVGMQHIKRPGYGRVHSNPQWFEMDEIFYRDHSDWQLIDVLGRQHSFNARHIGERVRIIPNEDMEGFFILYSPSAITEGYTAKTGYLNTNK